MGALTDFDFWLGPAPKKPYHPHRVHQSFRGYWDYDGGGLGDMGQHYLDPVQYILGKDDESPVQIEADTSPQDLDCPDADAPARVARTNPKTAHVFDLPGLRVDSACGSAAEIAR